jgi:ABC-type antimicrobial peptide transport system permease subunit
VLYAVAPLLCAIIVVGAIVVVSNAFLISANEQLGQYGILKSAGATTKQIRATVMSEGRLMSVIAIPSGVLAGYVVTSIGMLILTGYLGNNDIINDGGTGTTIAFHAVLHVPSVIAAAGLAFGTIMLSANRVAKKVSALPAIDAIKQQGEIAIRPGDVKPSAMAGRLFGFEGTLAAKSLKRSKRKYRATVVSLSTSIALLLAGTSFAELLYDAAETIQPKIPGNACIGIINDDDEGVERLLRAYPSGDITITFIDKKVDSVMFYCQAENPDDFCAYAERELPSLITESTHVFIANYEQRQRQTDRIYSMLTTFVYCFVGMLAAVGVTGVLATVGSNVNMRAPEFAVLRAVGMDKRGLSRMLNLESLLYGLRSLLIGIPIGLALSLAMYGLFRTNVNVAFHFPWRVVLVCAAVDFAATIVSMRYASGKLRRANIADTMRTYVM